MATTAKSVQARDAESVVNFYNNRAVAAFSIRQGNQLIYAYEGESLEDGGEELMQFIDQFVIRPRSAAIYTLCVHTALKGAISNKTEYNGSINFRMYDYADMYGSGNGTQGNYPQVPALSTAMESKINGIALGLADLQKKIAAPPPAGEVKPDFVSKLGVVGEILDHPLGFAIGKALIERFLPGAQVPLPGVAINGTGIGTMEEAHQKLNEALMVLIQADPNVPLYLYNLAQLSKNDPAKFQGFINMVKMFA